MATKVTILSYPNNINVKKAEAAARFGNTVTVEYDSSFQMGVTNKTPEFLKDYPIGKVPVAITPDGPLWESNAIAKYVARKSDKSLLGNNDYEASVIDQWVEFCNNELMPEGFALARHLMGYRKHPNQESFDQNLAGYKKVLGQFESALGRYKFLAADRITFADIVLGIGIAALISYTLGKETAHQFPKTIAYVESVLAQPQFNGQTITYRATDPCFA